MARLFVTWGLLLMAALLSGGTQALAQPNQMVATWPAEQAADGFPSGFNHLPGVDAATKTSPDDEIRAAIWQASQRTGVDYHYLLAKAQIESGLNPEAKARTSSASGLFQFIEGTWLSTVDRHSAWFDEAGADSSQLSRGERLSQRNDPRLASMMAAVFTLENSEALRQVLGRQPNHTELYLAHFLGTGGAKRFVRAWKRNPQAIAANLFPRASRANRSIFYSRGGRARSLAQVLSHFDAKLAAAKADVKSVELAANDVTLELHKLSTIETFRHTTEERTLSEVLGTARHSLSKTVRGFGHRNTTLLEHPLSSLTAKSGATNAVAKPVVDPRLQFGSTHSFTRSICNHIEMCYPAGMSTSTITQVRELVDSGAFTKAGIARAAGLHANTLRDASEPDWNPTAETLAKLQRFLDANDETPVLVGIEEIIDEARNGRMYILVDDEDRENEGDLIIPAQMATPAAINFMATHGRGLICLALDKPRVDQLGLEPMSRNNKESMQTAFTISIEAKEGVTTGISAADRARTVSVAIDATKGADDIVTPGHVFPLTARDGGTLVRAGHTEAAVDISRLAGLNPSGVICEIMNEDGTMARLDDLVEFARKHDLKIGTIRDLIAYRMRNDHLVERINERTFESDYGGQWRMITYRNKVSNNEAYVLQKGHVVPGEPTLARVHPISVFDDVLGAPGPRKRTLQRAMGAIGDHGSGIIVILTQRVGTSDEWTRDEEDRNIGIGSQILADLGVHDMVLLSNSRPELVALDGYGITIKDHMPIPE